MEIDSLSSVNQRIRGKDMTPNNKHDLNIWGNNRKENVNPFIHNNFKHMNGTQGDIGPSNRDRTSNSKQKKEKNLDVIIKHEVVSNFDKGKHGVQHKQHGPQVGTVNAKSGPTTSGAIIYDVGFGKNSTIPMKAIVSHNRFTVLHENDNEAHTMDVGNKEFHVQVDDMVLETPL